MTVCTFVCLFVGMITQILLNGSEKMCLGPTYTPLTFNSLGKKKLYNTF